MSEVNVTIFDRNYRLAVTTGEEKMLEDCARQVNEQMLAVRAAGRVIAIDQIAVLTALELAYDAKKREHDAKKTAAAPPQPVQQQTPAAAVPTAASTPNEADSALFAEIHSLCSLCEEALFRDAKMGSLFSGDQQEAPQMRGFIFLLDQVLCGSGF